MPILPARSTDRLALTLVGVVLAIVTVSIVANWMKAPLYNNARPAPGLPPAATRAQAKAHDHDHPEKAGVQKQAVAFDETFRHEDGLLVTVHAVDHGVVAKKDAHDGIRADEDYVQLQVKVTNGGHHVVEDLDNLWLLSYGPKAQDAKQPRLTTLDLKDKALKGALKPGQSRMGRETFVVPCLCQDQAVLEVFFDEEGHQPSVFTGAIV